MSEGVLIIAEAGVNHNGDLGLAYKLCDAAKEAGADVVKFQTWVTENIITHTVSQADYQTENTGVKESQFDMLKRLELSFDDFRKIKKYCDDIGIIFSTTVDDAEGIEFLKELRVPFVKVSSGDIGNVSFLRCIGKTKLPVVLSSGMSSLADVDVSINALKEGGAKDITVLHCTTNYPCAFEDVNLRAMSTLGQAFHLPVGYSDHTLGIEVAIAAVAMGAKVIEKHFTLDRSMEGPDHKASIEPDELRRLVTQVRNIEKALGDGIKQPTKEEKEISKVVVKRLVARKSIEIGEIFNEDNVCIKRNDSGMLAKDWDIVIGRKATRHYCIDDGIIL